MGGHDEPRRRSAGGGEKQGRLEAWHLERTEPGRLIRGARLDGGLGSGRERLRRRRT